MKSTLHDITLAELARLAELGGAAEPEPAFAEVDRLLEARLGRRLFTILKYMPETHEVSRIHSSHPQVYPVGGRKQNVDSPYGRTVLRDARPMIFHNDADIAAHFPDAEKIRQLGASGMICLPVMWQGRAIASLNISGVAGQFGEREIPVLTVIAGLIAPAVFRHPAA